MAYNDQSPMAYNKQAMEKVPGLLSEGERLVARLSEIRDQAMKVGNLLHGPRAADTTNDRQEAREMGRADGRGADIASTTHALSERGV